MPPWTWDYDHYSGENKDMVGFFYQEDFENINHIDHFIMQRHELEEKNRKLQEAAARAKNIRR